MDIGVFEYTYPAMMGPDIGAEGENVEILAFELARKKDCEQASVMFDYAATSFYLAGHWNAGFACEWAAQHLDSVPTSTLWLPPSDLVRIGRAV